jgi:hypothetical protein
MAALGVPSAIPRDGKTLQTLVGPGKQLVVEERGTSEQGDYGQTGLTSDEEGEIEDHLRGLGYVE